MALFLNRKGKVIGYKTLTTGTIDSCPLDIRLIVSLALHTMANSVLLVHNHPTGSLTPSKADIKVTKQIKEALQLIDVQLLDHLIISESSFISMASKELL